LPPPAECLDLPRDVPPSQMSGPATVTVRGALQICKYNPIQCSSKKTDIYWRLLQIAFGQVSSFAAMTLLVVWSSSFSHYQVNQQRP